MNKLLRLQRRWLSYSLFIETLLLTGLGILYFFYPSYEGFFYIALGLLAVILLYDFILAIVFNMKVYRAKARTEQTSAEIIGRQLNEAYQFGQIGMAVVNKDNEILWINDFLSQRCPDIVDKKLLDVFPGLAEIVNPNSNKSSINFNFETKSYEVEVLRDVGLYLFKDVTNYENIITTTTKQKPVVGYIAVDNYSDVQMSVSDEAKFGDMASRLAAMIQEFSVTYKAMLRKLRDDRYFFITTQENFENLERDKFPIVDEVRNAFPNGFTLSLGISYNLDDYSKLGELAASAIDVALSRGGDQTVISPFGQALVYIGGKSEMKPARNKVKMRTISNSFLTILRHYPKVLIMGHDNADFDAIGSALGVYLLCQHVGVPARICWEDQHVENKCRIAVQSQYSEEDMASIFIDYKSVSEWISKDTLLVMVDHNNPMSSMFPEITKKMMSIAVVDHHRPEDKKTVVNPVFNGIDSASSSTSELLTSYILYSLEAIKVDPRTATFLLAGIALDTQFFHVKTDMGTFEACSALKNFNADSSKVDDFLKENLEDYRQKIAILNNSETPYYGCLLCTSPEDEIVQQTVLATVSQEAVSIRGISSCFSIGRTSEHAIGVSARGDGTVNVQMLMQKLGGGGKFSASGATLADLTVDQVKTKLKAILADYLEEATTKTVDEDAN